MDNYNSMVAPIGVYKKFSASDDDWLLINIDNNVTGDMDTTGELPQISPNPLSRNGNGRHGVSKAIPRPKTAPVNCARFHKDQGIVNAKGVRLDSAKYFGNQARSHFFENYQDMKKNRNIYSGHEKVVERSLESRGKSRLSLSRSDVSLCNTLPSIFCEEHASVINESVSMNLLPLSPAAAAVLSPSYKSNPIDLELEAFDEHQLQKSTKNFYAIPSSSGSKKLTSGHLSRSLADLVSADDNVDSFSPRTKYIGACIRENVAPLPRLILRKDETTTALNLSHYGIHDNIGKILSECLDDLPLVESIDISGNSLTDKSLPLLIKKFQNLPNLQILNLSRNKIDEDTSDALAIYLSNPQCPLTTLILQHADVDDFECARFIGCLKTNTHLKELDLSSNMIGTAEIFNGAKSASFTAGGKAIAEFIASSDCRLHTLKLGWNSLKMASSIDISKALSLNQTLVYLDLSYNGLSQQAGEYLGDSLQYNKTLHTLLLDNNQLNGNAVFSISQGLQYNTSIRRISLDKNPIGEFGARSIMYISEEVGNRTNLSIKGCNIKIRDAKSLLNFSTIEKDYVLNLNSPFERTIARWLLDQVAAHTFFSFSKSSYIGPTGKEVSLNLKLCSLDEETSYQSMDEATQEYVDKLRQLYKASNDIEAAEILFQQADTDHSGSLDRDEIDKCLKSLGYPVEPETLDDIFQTFDIDYCGYLDEDEFINFLESKADETQYRLTETLEKYFYALDNSPQQVYIPPKVGILKLSVVNNYTDKGPRNVITSIQQSYATELAIQLGDPNLVLEVIQHTRLRFNEGLKFYKLLNAENGNMAQALSKVLTRMYSSADARELLSKVTKNDAVNISKVKQALGYAYHPLFGDFNGFYYLNLMLENDRLCLSLLLDHSKMVNAKRLKELSFGCVDGKLGDTSQHGNWTCFRNEVFNNKLFVVTSAAFTPMKNSGILEFDFISIERPPSVALPITDFRLCRILNHLSLIRSDECFQALSILGELKDLTVYSEKNFARVLYETEMSKAKKISVNQDEFYNKLLARGNMINKTMKEDEVVRNDLFTILPEKKLSKKESRSLLRSQKSQAALAHMSSRSLMSANSSKKVFDMPQPTSSEIASSGSKSIINNSNNDNINNSNINDVLVPVSSKASLTPSKSFRWGVVEKSSNTDTISMVPNIPISSSAAAFPNMNSLAGVLTTQSNISTHAIYPYDYSKDSPHQPPPSLSNYMLSTSNKQNSFKISKNELQLFKSIRNIPLKDIDFEEALNKQDPESLPAHINDLKKRVEKLLSHPEVSENAKGIRIYEILTSIFAKSYLRCRHLVLLIKFFKYGNTARSTLFFGSYLVDLIVFFYSRIVDLHNFEIVIHELSAEDCGAMYCRIGWLNIFNPAKVDGCYELQIARIEERIITKMLITLSMDEPCENFLKEEFQWERNTPPIPGWEITNGWLTAEGMPVRGLIRFHFVSYGAKKVDPTLGHIGRRPTMIASATTSSSSSSSSSQVVNTDNSNQPTSTLTQNNETTNQGNSANTNDNSNTSNTIIPKKFIDSSILEKMKDRVYITSSNLRRMLCLICLMNPDACLICETDKLIRKSIYVSKKLANVKEMARAHKTLWQYVYN